MRIVLAYVFPTINHNLYQPMARRFTATYLDHPPGTTDHKVTVLLNGPRYPGIERTFDPLPVEFRQHNNVGRDIGAFQMAADTIPCDLLVCFGSPVRFRKAGWLDWIVQCYLDNGPGLYASWGMHQPLPHLRTTVFWCPPELLNAYPYTVGDQQRYPFEHGPDSLTLWSQRMGWPTLLVTWKGAFAMPDWHVPDNEDCLFLDQNTDRMNYV